MSTESNSVFLITVIEHGIHQVIDVYGTEETANSAAEEFTKNFDLVKVTEWEIH
ncbi:hypothetical protein LCGC14_3024750 [marine sediment metagenome]|uniref:Uncharacterized protein n=1 Tax=marine sediment metagenome TaxID=412755 RepID=A0A0F8WU46_9ZZZZ